MAKSKSQKQQQSGGFGAADYALKVYGGVNAQHAVGNGNNAIAMNDNGSTASGPIPSINGGGEFATSSLQTLFRGRGGKLSKQQLQKTVKKQLKQLKQQNGGELQFSELNNGSGSGPVPPVTSAQPQGQSGIVAVHKGGNSQDGNQKSFSNIEKAFAQKGGKLSKQQLQSFSQQLDKLQQQQQHQQQQGGVGLNEIVVPLLLLYASQKYAQGKTTQKNAKSLSRSVRKSRRFSR
jgi:hypothetical protein